MKTEKMALGKKAVLLVASFVVIVFGASWVFVWVTEARQDASVLTEKLDGIPVPTELVLVDEWEYDGSFMAGRSREAGKAYITAADVTSTCARVDSFYSDLGIALGTSQRTDVSDEQWCGRTMRGRNISIWVEDVKAYSLVPEEYRERDDLVSVRYSAY